MGSSSLPVVSPSKPNSSAALEEDSPSPTTALLSFDTDSSPPDTPPQKSTTTTILFIVLLIITCVSLAASGAFAFLFFSSSSRVHQSSISPAHQPSAPADTERTACPPLPSTPAETQTTACPSLPATPAETRTATCPPLPSTPAETETTARPLTKLDRPVVLLISSDGFRFGYQFKTPTPNIGRLIANGTEAETGLISVFPTLTFPNHYSIATGLYPAYHGIINNYFVDPVDGDSFNMGSHEPKWWLGEPLWETVANHGLQAATFFWPGSEVHKGNWNCPSKFCQYYNGSVPFEERVDTILHYFDLPSSEIPVFMTLYFEDPDHQGHQVGPDDPEITEAVARIDRMIGRLIDGLEKRGVFEDVTIIMVGDHGMVGTCDKKLIYLHDLSPWIDIPKDWVQSYSPLLSIRPPAGVSTSYVVSKMMEGLSSGKFENGKNLRVFLKEDLPDRLHYVENDRISPIIGLVAEGFKVEQTKSKRKECGGAHGYDNAFFSMRTIFIGHGPQFARGRKVPSFENIHIYNLVTSILKIQGAPNNGSASFPESILLSSS